MKLWQKQIQADQKVDEFTVGKDREWDLQLAPYDVLGSLAHTRMLTEVGLLDKSEFEKIEQELKKIYHEICSGKFEIEPSSEDIHSQIELMLTDHIGKAGKRIHTARSRNDQVLVDIKLFLRDEIREISNLMLALSSTLLDLSEKHKHKLLPGYTHLQLAMPSSFGLWFAAYAESFADDLELMLAAYKVVNKNPLGSGAGYGGSFPIDRSMTTKLLGFTDLHYNSVYAQMTRGKSEKFLSSALSAIAATLAKLAMDVCLFLNQNFDFISFPQELTTGSSIMPHKKNPDVFELVRGKCNLIQSLPGQLALLCSNLPSGYHRDMQLTKDCLFPALKEIKNCLRISNFMLKNILVKDDILNDTKYQSLFTVEAVNREVLRGAPFRDAYRKVGVQVENGTFVFDGKLNHTHEGSIGNLCNDQIRDNLYSIINDFNFELIDSVKKELIGNPA